MRIFITAAAAAAYDVRLVCDDWFASHTPPSQRRSCPNPSGMANASNVATEVAVGPGEKSSIGTIVLKEPVTGSKMSLIIKGLAYLNDNQQQPGHHVSKQVLDCA